MRDFTDEPRWTRCGPAMTDHGIGSLLSLAIVTHEDSPAALNLYSTRPHAFNEHSQSIASIFTYHAAIAIHGATAMIDLERALDTRDTIGQAKGILIERLGVSSHQAFDLLVESSQHTNIKVSAIADWLIAETGSQKESEPSRKQRAPAQR